MNKNRLSTGRTNGRGSETLIQSESVGEVSENPLFSTKQQHARSLALRTVNESGDNVSS